ncbi:MAG TPA: DNA mismatch repair protein MutS, partial [Bacteroidales bacterium]
MMRQFLDIKQKYPDALLLFRCGDFYETYSQDAVVAADLLGITLTKRANGQGKYVEMAGFPHHALDTYLPKIVRAGRRVAICDQLEDPKLTKKLVRRGVTELVTPGVSTNDAILERRENNFLGSVHIGKNGVGIALLDISTGEFLTAEGTPDYIDKLINNFAPKEILYERTKKELFESYFGNKQVTFALEDWIYTSESANDRLLKQFETKNLKGFGIQHLSLGIIASGAILFYMDMTQHSHLSHITHLSRIEEDRFVRLDKYTVRSLELLGTMQEGGTSLLNIIDRTVSPMGARLLRRWLVFPLKEVKPIRERQAVVEEFFRSPLMKEEIDQHLSMIGDLERIISRISVGRVSPREIVQLKHSLLAIGAIKSLCAESESLSLQRIAEQLNPLLLVSERIEKEIKEDAPVLLNKGNVIKERVN